jgi:hypothetical protein
METIHNNKVHAQREREREREKEGELNALSAALGREVRRICNNRLFNCV